MTFCHQSNQMQQQINVVNASEQLNAEKRIVFFIIRIVFPGSDCPLPVSIQAQCKRAMYKVNIFAKHFCSVIRINCQNLVDQGSFAPSCANNYWKLVEEEVEGVEELHCDQHSHPFPLHPSPCPPIGQPWSAGQTLASYWWRMERGILENFASISTGGGEGAAGTWH